MWIEYTGNVIFVLVIDSYENWIKWRNPLTARKECNQLNTEYAKGKTGKQLEINKLHAIKEQYVSWMKMQAYNQHRTRKNRSETNEENQTINIYTEWVKQRTPKSFENIKKIIWILKRFFLISEYAVECIHEWGTDTLISLVAFRYSQWICYCRYTGCW